MSARKSLFFSLSLALHAATVVTTHDQRTALAQSTSQDSGGDTGFVRLRPIDRATVRIFALTGMSMEVHRNEETRRERAVAVAQAGHGSGLVVDPDGFIVTAAHVVDDAQQIAVVLPGSDEGYPADVVYTDPSRDIAILRAGRTFQHYVTMPTAQPTVQLGDRVGITGYPLIASERMPAASSGEIARLTNDGMIQLSATINPGNSGGPVIDRNGALVGVVSSRFDPRRGAQGIGFIEPIAPAIRALAHNVRRSRPLEGVLSVRKDLAQVVVATLRSGALGLEPDGVVINRLTTAISTTQDTDAMALFAGYLWNAMVRQLEASDVDHLQQLPEEQREVAVARVATAITLAQRAVRIDRSITRRYQVVQSIIEIGERVAQSARQNAARGAASTAPTVEHTRSGGDARAGESITRGYVGALDGSSTAPEGSTPSSRARTQHPRMSFETGGGLTIDHANNTVNGGGGFVSGTYDILRWEPSRMAAFTFLNAGLGVHIGGNQSFATTVHADLGMRMRFGNPDGVSFAVSAHYTPGIFIQGDYDGHNRPYRFSVYGMYLGYRADATLFFFPVFGVGFQYSDQYNPDRIYALRMVNLALVASF
jgi:S1-C subfamily serine protease